MELQTAFYIIGIVFMGLMILMFIALLTAVLVIKSKINKVHDMVSDKFEQAKSVTSKLAVGFNILKKLVNR